MSKTIPLLPTSEGGMPTPAYLWALLLAGMLATCVLAGAWSETAKGAFPGTNGKLVVAGRDTVSDDTEIFIMNPNGTGVVQLTNNKTYDDDPAWSPDGKEIAYSHLTQSDDWEIFVMRADGTQKTQITHSSQRNVDPTWSPNGRRIAFMSTRDVATDRSDFNTNIYSVRSDGTDTRQLTKNTATDLMPDWSPDGTKIAFYTTRYDENTSDIAVINPDGSNVRRVTYTTGLPGDEKFFSESYPEWSPSGRRIAYQLYTNIYTIRADGTGAKKLTNADDDFFSQEGSSCPAWSPDGKNIAFCGTRVIGIDPVLGEEIYEHGIYLINSDGSGEKRIPGPDHVTALDWQRLPAQ